MSTALRLQSEIASGASTHAAWNRVLIECYRASRAHCLCFVLENFQQAVEEASRERPSLHRVLQKLCELFALYYVELDMGEFLEGEHFSAQQASMVHEAVRKLLAELRPDAVALCDGFNFSDYTLNSALGRRYSATVLLYYCAAVLLCCTAVLCYCATMLL